MKKGKAAGDFGCCVILLLKAYHLLLLPSRPCWFLCLVLFCNAVFSVRCFGFSINSLRNMRKKGLDAFCFYYVLFVALL